MDRSAKNAIGATPRWTGRSALSTSATAPLHGERDPGGKELLRLTRLCGINLITFYGLIAAIGDINRFANSRKLVAYLGLNPSVCQSGEWEGATALKRHGRGAIRALLIQSANKLLQVNNPLQK